MLNNGLTGVGSFVKGEHDREGFILTWWTILANTIVDNTSKKLDPFLNKKNYLFCSSFLVLGLIQLVRDTLKRGEVKSISPKDHWVRERST